MRYLRKIGTGKRPLIIKLAILVPLFYVFSLINDKRNASVVRENSVIHYTPQWGTFTPDKAGFTIDMPGTPDRRQTNVPDLLSRLIPKITVYSSTGKDAYSIGFVSIPEEVLNESSPDELIAPTVNHVLAQHGKPIIDRQITVAGNAGRELVFRKEQDLLHYRFFTADNRVFVMLAITGLDEPKANIDRFFGSFRLVSK